MGQLSGGAIQFILGVLSKFVWHPKKFFHPKNSVIHIIYAKQKNGNNKPFQQLNNKKKKWETCI
jgi:hypothetical protein